ncbi:21.7 kDa class VI heat shock protein isoform X2 [Amaranthus tricolor]|uniref:21.7 kDa class VI heat shock protein isoform X2 n=1 Tax=Amaranthus tricolor TaxID=29722 RepID=UPI0025911B20|nr:21.7 kDa class VI heat shock protein isoform X2 [Amaranthus tricolor]
MMGSCKQVEVLLEDRTPHKWIIPLTEDSFQGFLTKGNHVIRTVFGDGSLFSPMLFGKFFDPSDAFPLWDFEADVLLSISPSSGQNKVDWNRNDKEFLLKAELPGSGEHTVQVCIEKGKILEISGLWKQQVDSNVKNWKTNHWWEHGFVRRIELPENADWKKIELMFNSLFTANMGKIADILLLNSGYVKIN